MWKQYVRSKWINIYTWLVEEVHSLMTLLDNLQRLSATSKAEIKAHMIAAIFKSIKKCGLCLQRCLCSRRQSILSNSWGKRMRSQTLHAIIQLSEILKIILKEKHWVMTQNDSGGSESEVCQTRLCRGGSTMLSEASALLFPESLWLIRK